MESLLNFLPCFSGKRLEPSEALSSGTTATVSVILEQGCDVAVGRVPSTKFHTGGCCVENRGIKHFSSHQACLGNENGQSLMSCREASWVGNGCSVHMLLENDVLRSTEPGIIDLTSVASSTKLCTAEYCLSWIWHQRRSNIDNDNN